MMVNMQCTYYGHRMIILYRFKYHMHQEDFSAFKYVMINGAFQYTTLRNTSTVAENFMLRKIVHE